MIPNHLCERLSNLISNRKDEILLLIRLVLGVIFIQAGLGKLMHFQDTTAFFASINIPFPALNAGMASLTELVGGFLLIFGLGIRLITLPLAFIMVIAIVTTRLAEVGSLSDFIRLQELDYFLFFLLLFTTGSGKWSLDCVLRNFFCKK